MGTLNRRRLLLAAFAISFSTALPLCAQTSETVEQREVRQDGLVGRFHHLANAQNRTTVILLGGSEGGLPPAKDADDLARSGYPTLALGYFKDWHGQPDGLPSSLNDIPLEYFFHAIDWLKSQPQVNPSRIALVGQSRGGELVLLLGSLRPDIAGIIAFSPSNRVWGGLSFFGPPTGAARPAWTLRGQAIPFQKLIPQRGVPMRQWFLQSEPDEAARIPLEKIRASVLLVASRADALWPSATYADEAAATLAKRPGTARVENLQFDEASHLLMGTGPGLNKLQFPGTSFTIDFGGTPEGTATARAAAWDATKKFLAGL